MKIYLFLLERPFKSIVLSLARICFPTAFIVTLTCGSLVKVYEHTEKEFVFDVSLIGLISLAVLIILFLFFLGRGARWKAEIEGKDPQESIGAL
ncbi:hypothetical protein KW799_00840 [Candidatus Parcubacteria bacterium]|nr:hypothetical protein [Candidatus Parcubacteria bacterium]